MKFLTDQLYLAYNRLTVPKLHTFQLLLFILKVIHRPENYLKFSEIILKLIILFIATIQDQRAMYIFFRVNTSFEKWGPVL